MGFSVSSYTTFISLQSCCFHFFYLLCSHKIIASGWLLVLLSKWPLLELGLFPEMANSRLLLLGGWRHFVCETFNQMIVGLFQRHSITGSTSAPKALSSLSDKRPSYADISMPGESAETPTLTAELHIWISLGPSWIKWEMSTPSQSLIKEENGCRYNTISS